MQTDSTFPIKRRKPLFALLMSLILPGFGQLYNGEVNKAIWLFLIFALLTVPAVAVVALYLPAQWMLPALLGSFALALLIWLYSMVSAFRSARRQPDYLLPGWQRSGMYVLVFLLCNTVALPLLIEYVRQHQVESFRVPSGSMEPTVMTGDMFFADKRYNCPGCKTAVKRGDIAIFAYPDNRTMYFIKRIIGMPGEHVQVRDRTVLINGKPLTAQEIALPAGGAQVTETDGTTSWKVVWSTDGKNLPQTDVTVPAGSVFAMGDNRSASNDSRFIGFIPLQDVVGKARQVWLSLDTQNQHVRWERSGQVLQ
jgi:signal peptidase I